MLRRSGLANRASSQNDGPAEQEQQTTAEADQQIQQEEIIAEQLTQQEQYLQTLQELHYRDMIEQMRKRGYNR